MKEDERRWLAIIGVVIAFLLIVSLISYVFMPFLPWLEQRDAGEEVIEDTNDADRAVQEYEWFRQQYQDIEAQRAQIENSYDELDRFYDTYGEDPDEWDRTTKERHNRIQQRITGNQNMLEQMVADYNARSSMDNRALFKCNLPYQVDDKMYITGPPGSDDPEQPQDVGPDGNVIDGEPAPAEECDGLPREIN